MNKNLFIIFNIVFYVFSYFIVPYLPNFLVFGFMPFQLFCYLLGGPIVSIVWGVYFTKFFNSQNVYSKGNK